MEDLARTNLSLNGILESGETYVIAHNSANSTITKVRLNFWYM